MTDIETLLNAATEAGFSQDQLRSLSVSNPWLHNTPTAKRLQAAVSRVNPERAQQWIAEAGAEMSLAAAAAQQGLIPTTPDLAAEIAAFSPQTPEQQRQAEIDSILSNGNPYGQAGRYQEDGTYINPIPGRLTDALRLEALAPEQAASLKLQAQPLKPAPGALTQEGAAFVTRTMAEARLASLQQSTATGAA